MNRDDALLKLLAVEPERRDILIAVTGWPADETGAVLDRLVAERRVTYRNGPGSYGESGRRLYYPRAVDGTVERDLGAPALGLRAGGAGVRGERRQVVRGERAGLAGRHGGAGAAGNREEGGKS